MALAYDVVSTTTLTRICTVWDSKPALFYEYMNHVSLKLRKLVFLHFYIGFDTCLHL